MNSCDKPQLTSAQWRMLRSLASTGDAFSHLRGRSQHGGARSTLASLWHRGLADRKGLTQAGRERLIQAGVIPTVDADEPVEAWRSDGRGNWYGVARLDSTMGLGVPVTEIVYSPNGEPNARVRKATP